ncbi:hypothetical protein R1flu_010241 [Riccia fluitans]|uniref:Uncharacterized protein n=1 Tax=Riccia fluitans TaxID=41844 RepID=A0ABD1Z5I5_9MARC
MTSGGWMNPLSLDVYPTVGKKVVGTMASEQAQKIADQFFHHDKPESETPPVDPEFGKKPAKDSGLRQAEHKEQRAKEAAAKSHGHRDVERSVKESLKQADEYGRDMSVNQTAPQTLLDDQNPFGGSMNEKGNAGMDDPK